jgi:hypothetical protein
MTTIIDEQAFDRLRLIEGLRELAYWLEQNPHVPTPYSAHAQAGPLSTRPLATTFADASSRMADTGKHVALKADDDTLAATVSFSGGVDYTFFVGAGTLAKASA